MSRRIEIGFLLALCIFLPLYEAPKTLAWAGYVVAWLTNRALARDFGGRLDVWDTLIALWLVSGFVIAPFAGLHGGEWRAPLDIVRNATVLWMVKRSRLTEREARGVIAALIISVLIGLAMGFAQLWRGETGRLELNSVGHVNHTAVYLAIVLGVCVSWLYSGGGRFLGGVASLVVLVALFVAASRAGVLAGLLTLLALAAAWWPRSRLPAVVVAAVLVGAAAAALLGSLEVLHKNAQIIQQVGDEAWRLALSVWQRYPWFGVGMDNFQLVTGQSDIQLYRDLLPHAHNLYLNTLAERGLVGAAPPFVLLCAWGWRLARLRPQRSAIEHHWLLWGAAAGAWIVTVVVGMVNTTLHHEHGLLAVLLLGLWLPMDHRR